MMLPYYRTAIWTLRGQFFTSIGYEFEAKPEGNLANLLKKACIELHTRSKDQVGYSKNSPAEAVPQKTKPTAPRRLAAVRTCNRRPGPGRGGRALIYLTAMPASVSHF